MKKLLMIAAIGAIVAGTATPAMADGKAYGLGASGPDRAPFDGYYVWKVSNGWVWNLWHPYFG